MWHDLINRYHILNTAQKEERIWLVFVASFDQQLSAAWESSRSSGSAVHGIGYSVDVDVRAFRGGGGVLFLWSDTKHFRFFYYLNITGNILLFH